MLSIALTKGRLEKESVRMFERCGYGVEELKNKGRQLVFHDTVKDNRYFLVKAADSVTYVEHGVADIGFVGKDTLMEANGKYYEMMDLGIGKCGFIVAALPGCSPFEKIGHIKIGSKYPNVARRFFESKQMDVRIIKIEGSVELAPLLGLSDGIVDIVETGATLRENGLEVVEPIHQVSARLIVNAASLKLRKQEIEDLAARLELEIQKGEGK